MLFLFSPCGILLFAASWWVTFPFFSSFPLPLSCATEIGGGEKGEKVVWWCYVGEKWGIGACVPIFTLKICFSRISYEGVTFCGKFGRWISNVLSQLILPDYLPCQHILVAKQSAWKIHLKIVFFSESLPKKLPSNPAQKWNNRSCGVIHVFTQQRRQQLIIFEFRIRVMKTNEIIGYQTRRGNRMQQQSLILIFEEMRRGAMMGGGGEMSTLSLSLSPFSPFHLFLVAAAKQKCRLEKRGGRAVVAYRDLPYKYINEIIDYKMHHDGGRNVAKERNICWRSILLPFLVSYPIISLVFMIRILNSKIINCCLRCCEKKMNDSAAPIFPFLIGIARAFFFWETLRKKYV